MADSDDDSADLSLKLRRGSSDSRDSFYMEFDQGIDSDIEAVEAAARQREEELLPPPPLEEMLPVESAPAAEQGVAAAELSDLPEEDEEDEEEGVVEVTVVMDSEVVVLTDTEDVVLGGEEEALPLPEEVLPLPEEVLPLPDEVLPLPEEVLPLPEEVLPLPEEMLPLPEEVLMEEDKGGGEVRIDVEDDEIGEVEKEDEWMQQDEQGVGDEQGVEEGVGVGEDQGVEEGVGVEERFGVEEGDGDQEGVDVEKEVGVEGKDVVEELGDTLEVVNEGGVVEEKAVVEEVAEEEERAVDEGLVEEQKVVEEEAIGAEGVVQEDVGIEEETAEGKGVDEEVKIDQVEESSRDEGVEEGTRDEGTAEVKEVVDEEYLAEGVLEVEESMTEGDESTVVDVVEVLKEEEEESSLVESQDFVVEVEKEGPVQVLVEEKQREALPGPSGSALRLGIHREPSTTSSSSSDSASTPMRSRWDTSLQTTDTEVAAAAAAVALTGSPGSKPMLLPSPASPSAILVSPETLSPTRTTPPADHKQTPSAPSPAQPTNGPGMHRQAPTSLGIPSTQTGIMLYSPPMPPVSVQHHPHHQHHLSHHHSLHHGTAPHHQAAIKGVPEPPPPPPAPVELPPPLPRPPIAPPPPVPAARIETDNWKKRGTDALTAALSALYGKLLVVMGIAFPMAEVISTYIPPSFYEGFYLYLYIGSMGFLFYMYAMLLRDRATYSVMNSFKRARGISVSSESGGNQTDTEGSSTTERSGTGQHPSPCVHDKFHQEQQQQQMSSVPGQGLSEASEKKYRRPRRRRRSPPSQRTYHYGSFYLRMGAVAFGIGSMIYSGLEFGQYFELERNTKCHNVLLALTPATRMAFIFIQMYFIFLNNEMKVYKHKLLARFGLMHMIGTNLCVWLNVLVQETKHEILTFFNPENNTLGLHSHNIRQHSLAVKFAGGSTTSSSSLFGVTSGQSAHALHHEHVPVSHQVHHRVERGLKGPHHIYECRRTNIMGSLVQDASPFLFPCTIEYSLICAAILYVMWKNISRVETTRMGSSRIGKGVDCHGVATSGASGTSLVSARGKVHITPKRSPHHYSVDCARAHKGLFVGILVLVLTIISLILFFVLIGRPELVGLAVFEVNMCELTLYALSTLATIAGMIRVRELRYDGGRNLELDSILLIVSQTGMFIYSTFTVIGGHFTLERNTALVLATALASLVQTTVQTIFVLDASRRSCATASQIRRKPGREVVTFLLVANLAMWAVNTLEKSRAESHPVQLHFYGLWAWTIITHVSMPLAIFYRFHSTVCLCEIWKRAYKMKPVYM